MLAFKRQAGALACCPTVLPTRPPVLPSGVKPWTFSAREKEVRNDATDGHKGTRASRKAQEHQDSHKATTPTRLQSSIYMHNILLYIYIYTNLQALNSGLNNSLNNGLNNSIKAPGLLAQSRQTQTVIHGLGQKRPTMAKRDLLLAQSRQTQTVILGLGQQGD